MTKEKNKNRKEEKDKQILPTPRQLIFCFMSLFSLALIIRNSDIAIKYAADGLSLCIKNVIPSLFPFMVLSDITVTSGAASVVARILKKPMRLLFGIGGESGCSVILGMLCGFPVGARSAISVYDAGRISASELERLLCFCNSPSSAFLISAVGISLFGSRKYGVALYIITIISALITGVVGNLEFRAKQRKVDINSPHSIKFNNNIRFSVENFTTSDFTEAVSNSAFSLIKICAFVVFFTVFIGTLGSTLSALNISPKMNALLFGFFELTGGVSRSSTVFPTELGAILAAFCSGWSGLSVHFQIMSICAHRDISFKPYFKAKIFQGILCAIMMKIYLEFFGEDITFNAQASSLFSVEVSSSFLDTLWWLCFLTALSIALLKFRKIRNK